MISKVWLINMILALCTVFAGNRAYRVWIQEERIDLKAPSDHIAGKASVKTKTSRPNPMMREASYSVIAEKNLFSPDRQEPLAEEGTQSVKESASARSLDKKLNLYGVIIMENYRKALINNLGRKPDEPRNKWVSVGDDLAEFTVAAIEPDGILLKAGTEEYKIPLADEKGDGQTAGKEATESTSQPKVVNAEGKKQDKAPDKAVKKDDQGKGESEMVNTPFGLIKRKKD